MDQNTTSLIPPDPPPYDPGPTAMMLLTLLVVASIAVILLVAIHCSLLDPADAQCRDKAWGQAIKDTVLELAPILIALVMLRQNR